MSLGLEKHEKCTHISSGQTEDALQTKPKHVASFPNTKSCFLKKKTVCTHPPVTYTQTDHTGAREYISVTEMQFRCNFISLCNHVLQIKEQHAV
jgi:hypothetical protein